MAGRAFRGLWAKGEEYQPLITASWRRASSCHATTDIEDKIIPKKCYRLVLKHRERAQPLTSARGSKPGEIPQKHKCRSRGNVFKKTATVETFSRQMYVHIHTHTYTPRERERVPGAHTYTHTDRDTRARSPTHTHRHRLLWMWVTGPCSPSSVRKQSRSLLCSPTASAR